MEERSYHIICNEEGCLHCDTKRGVCLISDNACSEELAEREAEKIEEIVSQYLTDI